MESTIQISEQETQLLEEQRAHIEKQDRQRARADRERRKSYPSWENGIIANNYKQFKGIAAGEKDKHPSSGDKAIERIQRIEKMKRDILRFERYYDEDSEEVKSLLSSLEDYYAELEGDVYTANSFSGELIVRGADFSDAHDGWRMTVYSELFGFASLFKYGTFLEYKDLIKKGGGIQGLQGLKAFGGDEKTVGVQTINSLFARAVPVLYANLEYKVVRGANASQYRFIPISFTLARTDNLNVVFSVDRASLGQGSFYMTPQLAVTSSSDMAIAAGQVQSNIEKESAPSEGGAITFTEKMLAKQKRRRVLFVTVDTAIWDLANYDITNLDLNSIKLNFDFATSDYFFFGGGLSWRYAGRNSESFYGAFVNGGANVTLFRNIRPYVQVEAFANTGAELGLGAGLGIDFTIKHLLLNVNGGYNWSFDADGISGSKNSTFATIGVGMGFTW